MTESSGEIWQNLSNLATIGWIPMFFCYSLDRYKTVEKKNISVICSRTSEMIAFAERAM